MLRLVIFIFLKNFHLFIISGIGTVARVEWSGEETKIKFSKLNLLHFFLYFTGGISTSIDIDSGGPGGKHTARVKMDVDFPTNQLNSFNCFVFPQQNNRVES